MLNRNVPLAVCLSVIAGAAFAQSNQGTGYVFEFTNSTVGSGQFQAFVYNGTSLGNPPTSAGLAGANQVIAKPDGSQFYIVGSGGVQSLDPTLTTLSTINGLSGTPTQAVISPDGRYLLVATSLGGGASDVFVLNTTSNTIAMTQQVTGSVIGVVVSHDSSTAWILGEAEQTTITIVNLITQTQAGTPIGLRNPVSGASLGGDAQSMVLSPLGLLYVEAGNEILEIDPAVLQACLPSPLTCTPYSNAIPIGNITPGPLQFTPDGTEAYFVNQTPALGTAALERMSLPSHTLTTWPPYVPGQQLETFDSIMVASNTRVFAHSPGDTTLWDVAPDLSAVTVSTLQNVLPATTVLSVALSNELPAARYLFALVGGGGVANLYRVDLSTNTVTSQASSAIGAGTLQFAYVPQEANPSAFLQYNTSQTLAAGATSAPLIARVLDLTGRPVFAVPVTFTGDPSLTFTNVSQATNADGYVQATVTMGQTAGTYPVTLTAGTGTATASTTFTLTLPGSSPGGGTGPGGGSGPVQMTIVSGNGELFQAGEPKFGIAPLTVQVLDTSGNPLAGAQVTFVQANPTIAGLDNPNAVTDANGIASTDFSPGYPPQNTPFVSTTVTATSPEGSVTFTETIFQANQDGTGTPSASIVQPVNQMLTVGEGDVLPEAIIFSILSHAFSGGAIPNVGIRIADPSNPENNGPGSCQGNPLSGQDGSVHCAFVASCTAGLGLHGFDVIVGEYFQSSDWSLNIVPGATTTLVSQSGNNQSGRPGAGLSLPLIATVTDQCGTPSPGVTVTWRVTQGSATLSTSSSVSNAGGTVSTQVTLGQTPGTVQITASIGATTGVTFNATIQAVVGSLTLASGNGQTALLNQPFAQPLVFQINDTTNNPLPGVTVNFSIASGSASLSVASATTNAQGQASVTVTAGNAPSNVTITATYATYSASAALTVIAPGPNVTLSSFVNAASGQVGLVPCGLATVTGAGLAPSVSGVISGNTLGIGPLPLTLSGVTITVGSIPAPLLSVSNEGGVQQVNFQTPCEIPTTSNATVVVQVGSTTSTTTNVPVYAAQPGIFTFAENGTAYGWVISATDGSYLSPTNLAHAGQTYYLVATGLGQTTPAASTNAEGTGGQIIPVSNVVLAIDNIGVPVTSVEYLQGEIGEYVITFTIPSVTNTGAAFPTGTNFPIALGVVVNGQTIYDNSPVALPGIH